MTVSDLKEALRNTRDMDCYLEARSAQEVIQDMAEALSRAADTTILRDHFAGQALIGVLSGELHIYAAQSAQDKGLAKDLMVATVCYEFADAMLKARAALSSEQEK